MPKRPFDRELVTLYFNQAGKSLLWCYLEFNLPHLSLNLHMYLN